MVEARSGHETIQHVKLDLSYDRPNFIQKADIMELIPSDIVKHIEHPGVDAQITGFQELFIRLNMDPSADELRKRVVKYFKNTPFLCEHLRHPTKDPPPFLERHLTDTADPNRATISPESYAVAVRIKYGVKVVRRDELEFLHERLNGLTLVDFNGKRYLARNYSSRNAQNIKRDVSTVLKFKHACLPQIWAITDDDPPTILFRAPESPVISLMKLLHDYYAVKDSWRLRALAVRAFYDIMDAARHMVERDMAISRLSIHPQDLHVDAHGHTLLIKNDLSGTQGAQGSGLPAVDSRVLVSRAVRSVSGSNNNDDLLVEAACRALKMLETHNHAKILLPETIDQLIQCPTSALHDQLAHLRARMYFNSTAPLLPGDILHVPDQRLPHQMAPKHPMPHRLCNAGEHFGGQADNTPIPFIPPVDQELEVFDDPGLVGNTVQRFHFQGAAGRNHHIPIWLGLSLRSPKSEIWSRYSDVLPMLARHFNIPEDQLILVTDVDILMNAGFECVVESALPSIYLFLPNNLLYMPYWSLDPEPSAECTPLGPPGTKVEWSDHGYLTKCTNHGYSVNYIHLEKAEILNPDSAIDLEPIITYYEYYSAESSQDGGGLRSRLGEASKGTGNKSITLTSDSTDDDLDDVWYSYSDASDD